MSKCTTKVNLKYQVVIPKAIRKEVSVLPDDQFGIFVANDDTIILKKIPKSAKGLRGIFDYDADYLKNERLSW